jgi:acyl-CoA thioesterase-1
MKFLPFAVVVLGTLPFLPLPAADAGAKKAAPAKKAVHPSFVPVPDVAGLPRVLLIGDSISMGYTVPVRTRLAGIANVHRPLENCGDTARGVKSLDKWLGEGKWDVIHFNFGLHDLKYLDEKGNLAAPGPGKQVASTAVYEANLRAIVARLKQTGAKLIYATTTPVPAGTTGRLENDERPYNAVALRVMKELGVAVDDLQAFVASRQTAVQLPKNVHFSPAGYDQLADAVVDRIRPALR